MPPIEASAPGSIGKNRPLSRRCAFSALRVTPGSTTQSRSSACTAMTRFMWRQVDRQPAMQRVDVALERGAGAEGHDRRVVLRADPHRVDHVLAALGEQHRVGRRVGQPGQRMAVLDAHRLRGDDLVAEFGVEVGGERGDGPRGELAFAAADDGLGVAVHEASISPDMLTSVSIRVHNALNGAPAAIAISGPVRLARGERDGLAHRHARVRAGRRGRRVLPRGRRSRRCRSRA